MKRFVTIFALLLLSAAAFAQVIPQTMSFQGRLTKPDGTPVADGNYSVNFSLYDALTAGNLLWQQTGNVAAHNGAFAAKLDFSAGFASGHSLYDTFGSNTPYLEIKIGTSPALTPRQTFNSVAYALSSGTANSANHSDYSNSAGSVANGSITFSSFAPGVLNFGNIAGQITGSQIAPGAIVGSITSAQAALLAKLSTLPIPGLVSDAQVRSDQYTGIKIVGRYAYILAQSSSNLQVYDISNLAAPLKVSETSFGDQGTALTLSGNYAYILNAYDQKVKVVNISTPVASTLVNDYSLGSDIYAQNIAVAGTTVYFGAYDYITSEWKTLIYNFSNPASPVKVGSFSHGTYSYPQSFLVSGNTLYVGDNGALEVYDITTPTAPVFRGETPYIYGLQFLALNGNVVYAGGGSYLTAIDVSNPTAPTLFSSTYLGDLTYCIGLSAFGSTVAALCSITSTMPNVPNMGALKVYDFTAPAVPVLTSTLPTDPTPNTLGSNDSSLFVISQGDIYMNGITTLQSYDLFGTIKIAGSLAAVGNGSFGGSVGIGTTTPAYKLDVMGDINASGSVRANGVALTSDSRYKTNIAGLNNALDDVLNLRGVTYEYDRAKWPMKNFPEGKQIGFIAQEIEKIFPELVETDANGYKSVRYQNMTPVLVEAIKTLKAQMDEKQRQIDELRSIKTENAELKKQNAELNKQNAAILDKLDALAALVNKMQTERK